MSNCPALISRLYTPKVLWYQTDAHVVLRIILTDVEQYYLFVDYDHLRFSTINNDREYYLCLNLFGTVIPDKCRHTNLGREINVNLSKAHRWVKWLRLQLEKTKDCHIIPDPDRLEQEVFVPERKIYRPWDNLEEYKHKNNLTNIMPLVPSSDEEESDDEMMDALFD